ncbi:MAG: hypothetical protein J0I16_18290 [Rhizobiales bacterium]|nr:hypothetical protein [Hyphomicrobiales bacterium]
MSVLKPFAVTIGVALLACGTLLGLSGRPAAQPAVSFTSSCEDLRANLQKLGAIGDELVTIEVVGALTLVKSGSGLAYLGMCEAPAPRVLCVTYDAEDLKPGDRVSISGSLAPRGPDHVLLDPCLHHREGTPP